jgi:hypothetical protein
MVLDFPARLTITDEHRRLGNAAYDGYCDANTEADAERGLPYVKQGNGNGTSARIEAARMGLVIESAFLDAMGLDPKPRVNPKGKDAEPDAVIDGVAIDVKGTSKDFPYISRKKAIKCSEVVFVTYTFDGDLLAIATGADYLKHGERCTYDDLPYVPSHNMKIATGFGLE